MILGDILYGINDIAIQNYLAYARGDRLDLKATIFGERAKRNKASHAKVIMECHISQPVERIVFIQKGTRFLHGENIFHSLEEGAIYPGKTKTTILAQAENPGDIGEILAGEITQIIDRYDYYQSCTNPQNVSKGGNEEDDEQYRKRMEEIPESFTSAGSEGSYKFWTKKVSQLVNQVIVKTPRPNEIDIYVYGFNEQITTEEKEAIKDFLTNLDRLPLNDLVTIKDPEIINIDLNIDYYLYDNEIRNVETIKSSLLKKLNLHFKKIQIGDNLNTQDIIRIIKNEDIKKCEITSPEELEITETSLIKCNSITLNYRGVE
ncbi:baseplate J/gp47 family protein [Cetobacterium sp. 2A]|uniref:baseplate J/gp47 family protein n=1 Tax=Cetobacterium sp. 2A TaxID=2754723 RepID=UPI00163CB7E3|nr:baseplate J/gp47 family protein [Cetobacterium sp. 2A]MBC2855353.1 baseplate J/gp47 family protein [Cetobacterium sp. 2A]